MPRELVLFELGRRFMPGEAARYGARYRKSPEVGLKDVTEVGRRKMALAVLTRTRKTGVWIEDGDAIRHRDWAMPVRIFRVPTMDELDGVARLLLAKGWERAAIVAAFVEVSELGSNQHSKQEPVRTDRLLSPVQFSQLGITGLKSKNTIQRYAEEWQKTGLPRPRQGEEATLPTTPFPEWKKKAESPRKQPPVNSDDPMEWAAWFRANKSPEFCDRLGLELYASSRTGRTRKKPRPDLRLVPASESAS